MNAPRHFADCGQSTCRPRRGAFTRLKDVGVTVKDRILLHLLDYWGVPMRGEWPQGLTQEGIASAIGITRSHVAVTIPDLLKEELVDARTERVVKRPRKVKVYALTHKGGMAAGSLVRRILDATVTAMDDTGEWDLPLDGLIQVHGVHMLKAIRMVDEDNRIDLRTIGEPTEAPEEEVEEEAEEEAEEEEEVEEERPLPEPPVAVEEVPSGDEPAFARPPSIAPSVIRATTVDEVLEKPPAVPGVRGAPRQPPPVVMTPQGPVLQGLPPGGVAARSPPGAPPAPMPQQMAPAQAYPGAPYWAMPPGYWPAPTFWNPLRRGSGRRPTAMGVAAFSLIGFLMLLGAVFFLFVSLGSDTFACIVIWLPLLIFGVFFGARGLQNTWTLGWRRESWVATILSAYAFLAVTLVCLTAFGPYALLDLLWVGGLAGLPALFLTAATGTYVLRRGKLAMFLGPVILMSSISFYVLEPDIAYTPALPIMMSEIGAAFAAIGWIMVHRHEGVQAGAMLVVGGAVGFALAALAGAMDIADAGDLASPKGAMLVLWMATAVMVALIGAMPVLSHLRPSSRSAYAILAATAAMGLLTASAIFIGGGVSIAGLVEIVVAVTLLAMVAPELRGLSRTEMALASWGALVAVVSVLVMASSL
jgi:hypothetical protein